MRSVLFSMMIASLPMQAHADDGTVRANAMKLPDVVAHHRQVAVEAAIELATDAIDAALLISIMWGESRFVPNVRTGRVCGIMQVSPKDIGRPRSDCIIWESDIAAAITAGIYEIEIMLADRRVKGNVRRALLYRSCGNAAFNGTCNKSKLVDDVLMRASKLRGQL